MAGSHRIRISLVAAISSSVALYVIPTDALACGPTAQNSTLEELEQADSTLNDESESTLARIAAFTRLASTQNASVRAHVVATGLAHDLEAIRGAALRCKFLMADALILKSLPYEAAKERDPTLSDAETKIVQRNYRKSFSVYYRDATKDCLSIGSRNEQQCDPRYQATVSHTSVAINYRGRFSASFKLQKTGRLLGEISIYSGSGSDDSALNFYTFPAFLILN